MKVQIKVTCSDFDDYPDRQVRLFTCREINGKYFYYANVLDSIEHECIEAIKQRLIEDREKLITWVKEDNHVVATLEIIAPKGITRQELIEYYDTAGEK